MHWCVYYNCRLRRGKAAKTQQPSHQWRLRMVKCLGLVGSAAARIWRTYMKPSLCWIWFATFCNMPTTLATLVNWHWPFLKAHLYHRTAVSWTAGLVIAVNPVVCVLFGFCGLSLHVVHGFPRSHWSLCCEIGWSLCIYWFTVKSRALSANNKCTCSNLHCNCEMLSGRMS